jgi:type I restriction enzyme S subunit
MDYKPKLRFPEFSGEWEEIQLNKLLSFKNGLNASKEKYGRGTKFINVSDILKNDFLTYSNIEGYVEVSKEQFENYLVSYGDVLFQRSSETRDEVGTSNVYLDPEVDCVFGGFVIRGRKIDEYEPFFLKELLTTSSVRKEITSRSGGSTRYNIGQESLKTVKINIPSIQEQKKIASFLSQIDRKIVLLETKQKLWETYKKGITQQIFNQKIRFKNKKGEDYPEWEKKKLDDISKFSKGKGISKNDISRDGIDCIRYGELYTIYKEEINEIISKTNLKDDKLVLSDENDIIIPSSGETAIDIATASCIMKSGVAIGGDTTIIQTAENGLFISYYLNHQRSNIARLAQGVSVVHLYSNQLKGLELNIPSIEEQKKIADFLSTIEIKIRQLEKELIINFKFKKGLLQQMFL